MPYSTSNPPQAVIPRLGGGQSGSTSIAQNRTPVRWLYNTSDGSTVLSNAGYFSNGKQLGMRQGDILEAVCWSTESATGIVLAVGVLGSTNSTAGWNTSTGAQITSTFS